MKRALFALVIVFVLFLMNGCEKPVEYINLKPTAYLTASPTEGSKPLKVNFDASFSSDPEDGVLTYEWDFGDGSSSTSLSPSHTFNKTGSFTATLSVTDGEGLQDMDQTTIKVNEPPDLFPITENAQWVYRVKATETENGAVSGYDNYW